MLKEIPVTAVKVGERLRALDEHKVLELMDSLDALGSIHPISVDEEMNLICGAHRLAAVKQLGWPKIEAKIYEENDLMNRWREIDENAVVNSLDYISLSEHIVEREIIIQSLGKRVKRGTNQYTSTGNAFTTDDLARRMNTSNKMYRLQRQVAEILPETRNALRGTSYAKKNLNDLLTLSKQQPDVQKRVGQLVKEDPTQTLRFHIDTAKIDLHTDRERSQLIQELKDKWGVPMSIMRFDRQDHQLSRICRQVSQHTDCKIIKGSIGAGRDIPNYQGFPDHSLFLLEYFLRKPNSKLLDNYCGKGTNLLTALWMGMEVVGFDLNPRNCDRILDVAEEHFPNGKYTLFNEDGVSMTPLKDEEETFDGILTDPPYLNCPDQYTDEKDDLSNVSQDIWIEKMRETFTNYYRLIKKSDVKDKVFHPLMMRMQANSTEDAWTESMKEALKKQKKAVNPIDEGSFHPVMMKMNASRRAELGMVSMDFILMKVAEELGFTLWDRTFNQLAPSAVAVSVPRNYDFHYTQKNWETTLIWIKQ